MPGDLNLKKSWNPALMKNQKKVWEREQQALKELQTIKQREKEIAQEREKEEMLRLQYGSDPSSMPTKDKLELNKLGWMYNDGPKNSDEDGSGFREVEEDFLAKSDEMQSLLRGNKAVKASAGSRFDKVVAVGAQASASTLSDDPLLIMKKASLKKRSEKRDRSPDHFRRDASRTESSSRNHRYPDERASSQNRDSYRDRQDRGYNARDSYQGKGLDHNRTRYEDRESAGSRSRGYVNSKYDDRSNSSTSYHSSDHRDRYSDRYSESKSSNARPRERDYRDRY